MLVYSHRNVYILTAFSVHVDNLLCSNRNLYVAVLTETLIHHPNLFSVLMLYIYVLYWTVLQLISMIYIGVMFKCVVADLDAIFLRVILQLISMLYIYGLYLTVLQLISMPHQWLEGNLPVSAKCNVCDKTCGSVLKLQDWRCLWCKAMVRISRYIWEFQALTAQYSKIMKGIFAMLFQLCTSSLCTFCISQKNANEHLRIYLICKCIKFVVFCVNIYE